MHGPLSFAIPSAVRGYAAAVERFGRMPWRDLVAPAVALARPGLPVDWCMTLKTAAAAEDLRRYDESRRVWLPDDLPPVSPPDGEAPPLTLGRLADTLARLAEEGPEDFYKGEIAQAIVADIRAAGGVLSEADLAGCRARIVPSLEIPYRGYSLQAARGADRGADPGRRARPAVEQALSAGARRGLFRGADRRAAAGLSRAARRARRRQAARRKLHDAHHRDRPRRRHRRADDDVAVELRQPLRAAADRHPDEQRHHVVRPAAGPAELDRPGQAGADQYVPARRGARRQAAFRGRRLGRPPHPRLGGADGELYRSISR